jgi:hypothetical protein
MQRRKKPIYSLTTSSVYVVCMYVCTRRGHLKINAICQTFKITTSSVSE